MATRPFQQARKTAKVDRLTADSVKDIETYLAKILSVHNQYTDLRNKMRVIDTSYFRYQTTAQRQEGDQTCGVTVDNMIIPVVISQVDTFVGYLAETYLSGYPTFPVVSTPSNIAEAEALEAIIDTHATIGGYARQLLKAFGCGIRYNFMPVWNEWKEQDYYDIESSYLKPNEQQQLKKKSKGYTCILSTDPYNTVWDFRVNPADHAEEGEWGGYVDRVTRINLKKLLIRLEAEGIAYNHQTLQSLSQTVTTVASTAGNYQIHPVINELLAAQDNKAGGLSPQMDWMQYFGVKNPKMLTQGSYELAVVAIRICPSEFGISGPSGGTPQIFKCWFLNGTKLIGFKKIYTVRDRLPLEIGMPLEDHFGVQKQGIAESQAGYQAAASALFNIRVQGARRSVSDRALYDPNHINPSDVNSTHAAPKIPVRLAGLGDKTLADIYHAIPFDPRGMESSVGDIRSIMEYSDMLSGQNKPARGQFQKGNKSVEEWRDTTGNADQRQRLPALNIEFQVFIPIKENIKFNLYQYGVEGNFQNFTSGETVEVDASMLDNIRKKALQFRIADGFTPKSKLASTDVIMTLVQTIGQSQILAASYGPMLPKMIAHLAQLGGVRGLNQYSPEVQNNGGAPAAPGQPASGTPPGNPGSQPPAVPPATT